MISQRVGGYPPPTGDLRVPFLLPGSWASGFGSGRVGLLGLELGTKQERDRLNNIIILRPRRLGSSGSSMHYPKLGKKKGACAPFITTNKSKKRDFRLLFLSAPICRNPSLALDFPPRLRLGTDAHKRNRRAIPVGHCL